MAKLPRHLRGLQLRWDELPGRQPFLRTATMPITVSDQKPHSHDYYEVFWVDAGRIVHCANDRIQNLVAGDLCFIRPDDAHAINGDAARITSCALHAAEHDRLRAAYAGDGPWPWDGPAPLVVHLGPSELAKLADAEATLRGAAQLRRDLDWFVLTLLRASQARRHEDATIPVWLAEAVAAFRERGDLVQGIFMLVHLSGRGHAYVSRCVRRHYGMDLTSLVNGIRLEKAAHLLRRSDESIPAIAAKVGLPNLSNFYRHFARRFGLSPKAYRSR